MSLFPSQLGNMLDFISWFEAYQTNTTPLHVNAIKSQLADLYQADQAERTAYQAYLKKYPDWQQAAAAWVKDKKRSPDDVFDDKARLTKAKALIQQNAQSIVSDSSLTKMAWLLVQHMDYDVAFQKEFLKYLKPETEEYKYLTDRVASNMGQKQVYGTQT